MTNKAELRFRLKQARLAMTPSEVNDKSRQIVKRLQNVLHGEEVTLIHCFEPIAKLHEVDVRQQVALWQNQTGVRLFTSRYIVRQWQEIDLASGQPAAATTRYDLIIVPMLGFDERLHRLGYGGGYYDRLLARQPQALKIGVCFGLGGIGELPIGPHDIKLDVVITENQIYGGALANGSDKI